MKVLTVFGTRPEAIKLAPVIAAMAADPAIDQRVCITGQHREMLDPVLGAFAIRPDHDLALMRPGQSLNRLASRALGALDPVLQEERPDRILVHGDTTTAMAAAVAAFHRRIPVGHVEAGLRTGDLGRPWPEEMNRRCIDAVADQLYAPTPLARANLLAENLGPREIVVTGNTVIDALRLAEARLGSGQEAARIAELAPLAAPGARLVLVTGHRRESFGQGFEDICTALADLAARQDVRIVYPVHLNPQVREPVHARLGGHPRIHLIEPLDYLPFVWLLRRAHLVLTDSGGVQEEAPSLGTPVLVMRDVTERPEAVAAGTAQLVGTDPAAIVAAAARLIEDSAEHARIARIANPYGDGAASGRILAAIKGEPVSEFAPDPAIAAQPAPVALTA
ncbi:UDP-N-acetylglucosamine 2-epimerase (non-hydrolyzing) [Paralimibaculum aggregatum]|uniref:UDP-N-acetylglucosamine 2-epimerase (non-hydrolyzing) n=1 Tax=Paralimibaculum aggregatum TaxID=3036245 RepID=A0ABQ6LGK5_9RHOB|nr:UDP-N-acetylglucosamine 2-epimerase (non-hydrolyzing) [Limibaculum sp. NKW23]GMG80812.1 UDP-N-acetylglucosamine 2-epimerase (non-hydrolyzing) [Limibaculum sp. NKW23]